MPPQTDHSPVIGEDSLSTPQRQKLEVLYDGYFYDVSDWVRRHPGGRIIEFYTKSGEDATLAFQQFHNRSIKRSSAIMKSLKRRKASGEELGLSPDTLKRHEALTKDFLKLHKELESEGFFKPSLPHTIYRFAELIAINLLGIYFTSFDNWGMKLLGIFMHGMFGGRCGWFMHEGGHHSITGNSRTDRAIQSLVFGYGSGMSASWWSSQHNRHHAMPQRLKHDVDLETLPLIAFNKSVVKNPKDGKGFFLQHQSKLFVLIDCFLVATFWKLYLHPRYALKKGAYSDLFFMLGHYVIAYYTFDGVIPYLMGVWFASVYIFVNFALSHTHLPVTDESLHWVEYSLSHTVDIQPSWWCDWWMSYLNYQIEHHLFPTMPQFRHKMVRERVIKLAEKHNIPYLCMDYWPAMKKTFANLANVSHELHHMH